MWAVYTFELLKVDWSFAHHVPTCMCSSVTIVQGLHYGRPSLLPPHHINTKVAFETTLNVAGQIEMTCKFSYLVQVTVR
jgi:hypothetical protein